MSIENPGSLCNWAAKHNLGIGQAVQEYPYVLQEFRNKLAENMGITLAQLHDGDFPHGDSLTSLSYEKNQDPEIQGVSS